MQTSASQFVTESGHFRHFGGLVLLSNVQFRNFTLSNRPDVKLDL